MTPEDRILIARLIAASNRSILMAVSTAAQAIIDSLNTAAANLQTAIANAGGAAAAQNTEDLAAIKTAADALVSAIDAAAQPPAS